MAVGVTGGMTETLQKALPPEMCGDVALPGVAPCAPDEWLRVDDAYAGQMALRAQLLAGQRGDVLWMEPRALDACREVLEQALGILDWPMAAGNVTCPDGRQVRIDHDDPLGTLGHLVQEDICVLQKRGEEHVLTGAVLCFPASWRLAEKVGQPLTGVHAPVEEYDPMLARRVQRLFDGVRAGRPLWRFNRLWYDDAALHQPRSSIAPKRVRPQNPAFVRSERQCIVRMPRTQAVVFSIHTYVVQAQNADLDR